MQLVWNIIPSPNPYHMEVWVDSAMKDQPTIICNACTRLETIQISFAHFETLVQPKRGIFCT